MAKITKEQRSQIALLTRRANRRIERAAEKAPGQARYLEQYVRRMAGADRFSAATKGLTYEQAAAKLAELESFLSHEKTTTRRGWEETKMKGVEKATATWQEMGYDITDEEMADILKQIDAKSKAEYYRAVNLVVAAKEEMGEEWEGTSAQIKEAISEKVSVQQALERGLKARKK